jgi:ATP-dependent DNA ligase
MKINSFTYFYPERPGLIHIEQDLFGRLSADPAWIAEPKFNGSRLLLHRLPSGIWQFWNRHQERFSFVAGGELVAALMALPLEPGKYYLFDGELRHNKTVGVRQKIVLYDCFIFGDELLCGVPFEDRRGILATLQKRGGFFEALTIAPQYSYNFREVYDELTPNPEIEGLVMKNLGGKLDLGRKRAANSSWMMKIRKPNNSYKF